MKRQHHKRLRVHRCEDHLRRDEVVCRCEDPLPSSEPKILKSKASGSPLQSYYCYGEVRLTFHYGNSKKNHSFLGHRLARVSRYKRGVILKHTGDWNREEEGDTRGRDKEIRIRAKIAKTEFSVVLLQPTL